MIQSSVRRLLTFTVVASLLTPLLACGNEKRLKECAARCEEEAQACGRRKERDCAERAKHCGEECAR